MQRRDLIKTGLTTGVVASTTGCLGWLPWNDSSPTDTNIGGGGTNTTNTTASNRNATASNTTDTENTNTNTTTTGTTRNSGGDPTTDNDPTNTANRTNTTESRTTTTTDTSPDRTRENQTGTAPNNTTSNNSTSNTSQRNVDINGNRGKQAYDPVSSDKLRVTGVRFGTNQYGARLQGRITNTSTETITVVDVAVTFLRNGEPLNTKPKYDGMRGLKPGQSWSFDISARDSKYATATDYTVNVIAEEPAGEGPPRLLSF